MSSRSSAIESAYALAKERYAEVGVDTAEALQRLGETAVSLHCWQGDDVGGFENPGQRLEGGLAVTGNFPGKARNASELRSDVEMVLSLIPGRHRLSLHAIYAETGGRRVDRNELEPAHFQGWIDWAGSASLKLDFNPTFFSHPRAASGLTLSHPDAGIRRFWVEHGAACRRIGAAMGKQLGSPCVTNVWIPDGHKDLPADRRRPRERLASSLDEIFREDLPRTCNLDAVESKLFGIGSESYVVGSHEFYLGYAIRNRKLLCLDMGHFHPTESVADKVSSVLQWVEEILLHVSRGVRWDSDHVVILSDEVKALAQEVVRGEYLPRARFGLDFFDASINRVAAWVIGARSTLKAILLALLEPRRSLEQMEDADDLTSRLALQEEVKTFPAGAVWDYHCLRHGVHPGGEWLQEVKTYERDVLVKRC